MKQAVSGKESSFFLKVIFLKRESVVCCSLFLIADTGIHEANTFFIELTCKNADMLYREGSSFLSLGSAGYKL